MKLKAAFWIVFGLGALNYAIMVLWSLPRLTRGSGGLMPFDLRPTGYSADEAQAFLSAFDPGTRDFYLGPQHWLDTSYPGLLFLTLTLAYLILFPRIWAIAASAVALAAAVFDWRENAAVAQLLHGGADEIDAALVAQASQMTVLKSGVVSVALIVLLIGLGLALWRRIRRKAQA